MSDEEVFVASSSHATELPPQKDALRKGELLKSKSVLEAEQRALQSTLIQLRSQQRQLIIENDKLKRLWQYREKVKNGEIDDPDVRDALESGSSRDSKDS